MYSPTSRYRLVLICTLFLVSIKCSDSVKTNVEPPFADGQHPWALGSPVESPYWENVLREYIFKTISPPPPGNNVLYKELLEAPFYRGPAAFPAATMTLNGAETSQVLSRGNVYRLAQGGWIICQEGCADCEICTGQRSLTVPAVRWILRRVKRPVAFPLNSVRHDLQLTVTPQADGSFHMANLSPVSYVYVTSNSGAIASGHKNPQDIFFTGEKRRVTTEKTAEVFKTETRHEMSSTLVPDAQNIVRRKQGREALQGGRNQRRIDYLPTETTTQGQISADYEAGRDARLILGEDQFGDKHIVHVVLADDFHAGITPISVHPGGGLLRQDPDPLQIEDEEHPLYRKIFQRVIDSLKTHKNAIENFLLSSGPAAQFGREKSARKFQKLGNLAPYHYDDSATSEDVEESEDTEENPDGFKPPTDYGEEIIGYSEETPSTFTTTDLTSEEDRGSLPGDEIQESNDFDELNSARNLSSSSLILKEVARSVFNHSDTPQGLRSDSERREKSRRV